MKALTPAEWVVPLARYLATLLGACVAGSFHPAEAAPTLVDPAPVPASAAASAAAMTVFSEPVTSAALPASAPDMASPPATASPPQTIRSRLPKSATSRLPAPSPRPPGASGGARASEAVEHVVWDKRPIAVLLGIGADNERLLVFPAPMRIGVPSGIASLVRVETVGRKTYLTAYGPFGRTRIHAENKATGDTILLDLSAAADVHGTAPIEIVEADDSAAADMVTPAADGAPPVDMVTLTRYAAQHVYGPQRLARNHPAIHPVQVGTAPVEGLYRGALLWATPLGEWRGDDLYVTAVQLVNLQATAVELTPLQVRGAWRAVTFQHGRLLPKGREADTTVVYLVCEHRFEACR